MDASKFLGGAVPVGGITSFTDSLGPDIEIEGKHYIQAGFLKESGFAPFLDGKERAVAKTIVQGGVFSSSTGPRMYAEPNGTMMVVVNPSSLVYRSVDGGMNWSQITMPADFTPFAVAKGSGNKWIAIGSLAYAVSNNDGVSFQPKVSIGNEYRLIDAGASYWIAVDNSNIWRTSDDGASSSESGGNFGNAAATRVRASRGGGTCIVTASDGRVWRSTNTGLSFTGAYPVSGVTESLSSVDTNHNGVWVVTGSKGLIARSEDDGATWERSVPVDNASSSVAYVKHIGNSYWLASRSDGLIASSDNGASWSKFSGSDSIADVRHIDMVEDDKAIILKSNSSSPSIVTLSKGVGLDASLGSTTYMRYK